MAWQGVAAPDFTVTTLDDEVLQLTELKGRRVVIDFWATWCGPCVHEVPHFNQLVEENPADELVVIGISKEPRDVIAPFADEHVVNFPLASANDLPAPYSLIGGIPTTFFIDRAGIIQSVSFGARGFDRLAERALADDYVGEVRSAPAREYSRGSITTPDRRALRSPCKDRPDPAAHSLLSVQGRQSRADRARASAQPPPPVAAHTIFRSGQ
jgi:peroxiredoxin